MEYCVRAMVYMSCIVNAETEDEAREKAENYPYEFFDNRIDFNDCDVEICDVECLDEEYDEDHCEYKYDINVMELCNYTVYANNDEASFAGRFCECFTDDTRH